MPMPRFCGSCQARPALPGRSECARCIPRNRALAKARYRRLIAAGLCGSCGKRPIMEGMRSRCEVCRESSRAASRKWKAKMRARGLY